jgi:hypothetical protein
MRHPAPERRPGIVAGWAGPLPGLRIHKARTSVKHRRYENQAFGQNSVWQPARPAAAGTALARVRPNHAPAYALEPYRDRITRWLGRQPDVALAESSLGEGEGGCQASCALPFSSPSVFLFKRTYSQPSRTRQTCETNGSALVVVAVGKCRSASRARFKARTEKRRPLGSLPFHPPQPRQRRPDARRIRALLGQAGISETYRFGLLVRDSQPPLHSRMSPVNRSRM